MTTYELNRNGIISRITCRHISYRELSDQSFDKNKDHIIFINANGRTPDIRNVRNLREQISISYSDPDLMKILFVSLRDKFDNNDLIEAIKANHYSDDTNQISVIIPYRTPPETDSREDEKVNSFIINPLQTNPNQIFKHIKEFSKLIYFITFKSLNNCRSDNLNVIQIGKEQKADYTLKEQCNDKLNKSLLLIPHAGNTQLLKRCLRHLKNKVVPTKIRICFDDKSYKKNLLEDIKNINASILCTTNKPTKVGPYLGRHYSIVAEDKEYVFFQDSDDISMKSRFEKLLAELHLRNLDMVGSHELRIDQLKKYIGVIRFPLDVNFAFENRAFHPLFHPTALIKKSAYMKTGGFSTDLRYGYDLQLTMRSHFILKMGNIDDFLYLRFKRPGSLTTAKKTGMGTSLRSLLWWRWRIEMRLVREGKLNLKDSILNVQKHKFEYEMVVVS